MPRRNFRPSASNGSSAASNEAFLSRNRRVARAASALWSTAKRDPLPLRGLPGGERRRTRSTGASRTFGSVTRTTWTPKSSPNVQPVSSYGRLLRVVGAPVLVVEEHVGDTAVGLVHADEEAAGGELARLRSRLFLVLLLVFLVGRRGVAGRVLVLRPSSFASIRTVKVPSRARSRSPGARGSAAAPPARPAAGRRPEKRTPPAPRPTACRSSACSSGRSCARSGFAFSET